MTSKIFRNSFLIGIAVLLLCSVLFSAIIYTNYNERAFERLEAEADILANAMEQNPGMDLGALRTEDRVTVIRSDGAVFYDSAADASDPSDSLPGPEVADALQNGTGKSTRQSGTLTGSYHYYALQLSDGSVLRLSCRQDSLPTILLIFLGPLTWIAVLVLILCGIMTFRLSRQLVKPINAINPDDPPDSPKYKELTPLLNRIREQNRTIRRQMDELSLRQREFTAITENMREGFFLIDSKYYVLSANHSALQLLGSEDQSQPGSLLRFCRDNSILRLADTALAGSHAEMLTKLDASTWQVLANPVLSDGQVVGAVLLLMDVTEREQRESLRREFSANVSHELKTPLTSISGFAELMKEGFVPAEKMPEFAADIYRESNRLVELVNDIIKLSRLDEGTTVLEQQDVDLEAMCQEILASLKPAAEREQIALHLQGGPAVLRGVPQLLREMIYNLCDNAIKYNVPNGSVTVTLQDHPDRAELTVADTGIGIPYAHQSRIFERFYRVDKSHSKAVGGTGLGLSIVKHAAQYHNAALQMQSEVGKGTAVTVVFPKSGAEI